MKWAFAGLLAIAGTASAADRPSPPAPQPMAVQAPDLARGRWQMREATSPNQYVPGMVWLLDTETGTLLICGFDQNRGVVCGGPKPQAPGQ